MNPSSAIWDDADTNARAIPYRLCPSCREFCSSSNLLRTLPQDYAKWDQEQKDGKPITLRPERRESYRIHGFSDFRQCVSEVRCHLCAIIWSELYSEAGYDPLEELQRREHEGVALAGVLKGGGKAFINHCLLTFEVGERRSNTAMQLLMSVGTRASSIRVKAIC